MDYSFLALQFLLLQCINGVMKRQIQAISRNIEGQETSESDPHQGKLENNLAFCTYLDIREKGIKSHLWKSLHVFRDDIGNIKVTKMVNGV